MSFVERRMVRMLKVKTSDFRDWNAIAAWAGEVPGKMGV
jgi:hypothetical protein